MRLVLSVIHSRMQFSCRIAGLDLFFGFRRDLKFKLHVKHHWRAELAEKKHINSKR